jgi:hypothetical protein
MGAHIMGAMGATFTIAWVPRSPLHHCGFHIMQMGAAFTFMGATYRIVELYWPLETRNGCH